MNIHKTRLTNMVNRMIQHPQEGACGFFVMAEIWRRGKLISTGYNSMKSHPLQKRYARHYSAIHMHAEIDAVRRALHDVEPHQLTKCTLYVARIKRVSRKGPFVRALAKPCCGCMGMILAYDFKEVYWTTDYGDNVD